MKYILVPFNNLWKLYIGLMFVTTLLLFYPIFLIFLSNEKLKPFTFKINVFWSRLMRMLCFYGVEIDGDLDEASPPFVLCANHTSYLDIFLMYSVFPKHKFLFMGKSEILSYPLVKTFFKKLNIPVYRDNRTKSVRSFIQARKAMQNNWSIVIFPEGGIPTETPYVIPFKDGAFQLAKAANVGIQPLTFLNNYYLFSDPENIFDGAMPGVARVKIHPFISKDDVANSSANELNLATYHLISSCLPKKIN
ncbi:MAG: lysophospholipid acyltransferase family protein [Brumimicrobium sp.]